jgi:hypothetical protein
MVECIPAPLRTEMQHLINAQDPEIAFLVFGGFAFFQKEKAEYVSYNGADKKYTRISNKNNSEISRKVQRRSK